MLAVERDARFSEAEGLWALQPSDPPEPLAGKTTLPTR
jgi:hypothetical protein